MGGVGGGGLQPVEASMAHTLPVSAVASPPDGKLVDADLERMQMTLRTMGRSLLATVVDNGVVDACQGTRLTLAFGGPTMTDEARQPETLALLGEAAGQTFGGTWTVAVGPVNPRALTDSPAARRRLAREKARQDKTANLREHPVVQALVAALDGSVIEVVTPDDERH
jgi:hypothetical protein